MSTIFIFLIVRKGTDIKIVPLNYQREAVSNAKKE